MVQGETVKIIENPDNYRYRRQSWFRKYNVGKVDDIEVRLMQFLVITSIDSVEVLQNSRCHI